MSRVQREQRWVAVALSLLMHVMSGCSSPPPADDDSPPSPTSPGETTPTLTPQPTPTQAPATPTQAPATPTQAPPTPTASPTPEPPTPTAAPENLAPVPQFLSPATGAILTANAPTDLSVLVQDDALGLIDLTVLSSRDGTLYTGMAVPDVEVVVTAALSAGAHTLTALATDADGLSGVVSIKVTAEAEASGCLSSDNDLDGYGDASDCTSLDCNDADASIHPGASELCDGKDQDCNGQVDDGAGTFWYRDGDGDGYGASSAGSTQACAQPSGYVSNSTDCNDQDSAIHPGAPEQCNAKDDNCDGKSDDGSQLTYYLDADGDGYGVTSTTTKGCSQPSGYASVAGDCNDSNASVHPGSPEVCNGIDDDCDGAPEAGTPATWYLDSDNDGYGTAATSTLACTQPAGYAATSTDCNDANPAIHPGAAEQCNAQDDNCDGQVDNGLGNTWYRDADGDGYGTSASTTVACSAPQGYSALSTDCNDQNSAIHPGASELCNGFDEDCNGQVDDGVQLTFYADVDKDGYGSNSSPTAACTLPIGYASQGNDCNDGNAAIHPGATEVCNSLDDDCDGQNDEGVAQTYYRDADADGYGTPNQTTPGCVTPTGYSTLNTDCNDGSNSIHPGALESCNQLDDDCDGSTDEGVSIAFYPDQDLDGFGNINGTPVYACASGSGASDLPTDCNDVNALIRPGVSDPAGDGVDSDCDGLDGSRYNTVSQSLSSVSTARLLGEAANDLAGQEVSSAGDVNGDGMDDILVGAPNNDDGGQDAGKVYLLYGPIDGTVELADADAEFVGYGSGAHGFVARGVGDINGDGYADVMIGAPNYSSSTASGCGAAYLFHGPLNGIYDLNYANAQFIGSAANDQTGYSVAGVGDVNKDGYNDIMIGAYGASPSGRNSAGAAYLFFGGPTLAGTYSVSSARATYIGNNVLVYLGAAISGIGDLNKDGAADFMIAASGGSSVYVLMGSSTLSGTIDLQKSSNYQMLLGGDLDTVTGASIASIGDMNLDGYPDVVIGSPFYCVLNSVSFEGAAYVVYLKPTLKGSYSLSNSGIAFRLTGETPSDRLGFSVSGGDVTGDGIPDLVLASPYFHASDLSTFYGMVYVMAGPVTASGSVSGADLKLQGPAGSSAGIDLSATGDINHDGYFDVVIGDHYADTSHGTNGGAAYVLYGPLVPQQSPSAALPRYPGDVAGNGVGKTVAPAGDVNGDGLQDFLIGAPTYDNLQALDAGAAYLISGARTIPAGGDISLSKSTAVLVGEIMGDAAGTSMASLGDINKDGYGDLLVGAAFNDAGGADAGAAYVVYGPLSGSVSLASARARLTGERAGDKAGASVAGLGDVNGDGMDDFIIGSPLYDDGSKKNVGAVYLMSGASLGSGSISLSQATAKLIGQADSDFAGASIAGAGDVNGDGYDDILIGAAGNDSGGTDAGAAYIVYGPVSGTVALLSASVKFTGEAAYDLAGTAVVAAGDVNRDGFADVLVSAPGADLTGKTNAGAVYLVLGSSSLSGTQSLSKAKLKLTGEAAGNQLGSSLSAGDVSGDGVPDLLLGAELASARERLEGGLAYLVTSPHLLSGTLSVFSVARQKYLGYAAYDHLGSGVAVLGDVNGDGFRDHLLGSSTVDVGANTDAGAAYLMLWGR